VALETAARLYPDRPALDFFGRRTTYAQLWNEVLVAARALADRGVGRGSVVGIALPNCPQHVVAFYAVARLGGVVVEHNPTYGPSQFAHQIGDCGATCVIAWDKVAPIVAGVVDREHVDVISVDITTALPVPHRVALRMPIPKARRLRGELTGGARADIVGWRSLTSGRRKLDSRVPGPEVGDVAALQYTGGTTGTPKGAVLTHANLMVNAAQSVAWVPRLVLGEEVLYGALPFFHAFGLTLCLTVPARLGALLVIFPKFDVKMVLAAQRRVPGTFFPGVAPMFERLVNAAFPDDAGPRPSTAASPEGGGGSAGGEARPNDAAEVGRGAPGDVSGTGGGAAAASGEAEGAGGVGGASGAGASGGTAGTAAASGGVGGTAEAGGGVAGTAEAGGAGARRAAPAAGRRWMRRGVDLTSFRHSICGAMALPGDVARRWEAATGGMLIEGYGLTETSPIALGNPASDARRPGTLGVPFPGTEMRIADLDRPDVDAGEGEAGELWVRGPQVFSGYWNRPEETAQCLSPDGWFSTGDVVVRDPDGLVRLVDRIKEVIITGGFNVYPSQVEDHLAQMPEIAEVAVVGIPHGDLGERVVAAVVLRAGAKLDLAQARAWCLDRLARYAIPKQLVLMTELPRSQVGKILRRVVRHQILGMNVPWR
jgi:acyl-CoA synthetase (AMP-forming)/AMP-acid ligase II